MFVLVDSPALDGTVHNPFYNLALQVCLSIFVSSCLTIVSVCVAQSYLEDTWFTYYPLWGELAVGRRIRRTAATVETVHR